MKRNILYKFLQLTLRPFLLDYIKELNGLENIPERGTFIVASNHESYLDPPLIKAMFDKYFNRIVYYLAKKEVYDNHFKRYLFNSVGTIPVDRQKRDKKALEMAIKKAKDGEIIGIFPEGTRSRDGKLHKGKTGAVRIALGAKCPILPIGINNAFELWPPHQKLPKYRRKVIINIGKPITLEKYYDKRITKKLLRDITDNLIMKCIAKLSHQRYVESQKI